MVYYRQNGLHAVGSFQVSGVPYLTGSTLYITQEKRIQFPTVAKSILIINKDQDGVTNGNIRVHFNPTGSGGNVVGGLHFFPLNASNDSFTINTKCKEIYVSCPATQAGGGANSNAEFYLVAELTGIKADDMFTLTGSGLTE